MARFSIIGRRIGAIQFFGLALATALAASRPAHAIVPTPTGFTLDISPSSRVLMALELKNESEITSSEYYDVKYAESCDNPHQRIFARNRPSIMIINDAISAAPITSFTLQINDDGPFVFGMGDGSDGFTGFAKESKYSDAGVSITGSSVSGNQKTLTVNFDGLDAGKMAIFCIDLDTTDPNAFQYPDYRMVLFGAPEEGADPTDPATATATFTNSTPAPNSSTLSLEFIPADDPDKFEDTPAYYEEFIRPYHVMDKIEVTHLGGVIPEPGSALLALLGVGALAVRTRRSR